MVARRYSRRAAVATATLLLCLALQCAVAFQLPFGKQHGSGDEDEDEEHRHRSKLLTAAEEKRREADQWVRLRPDEVRIDGGCKFEGCPAGKPFVYYLTSYRNRGASFNRWIRSVVVDIKSDVNTFPAQCVCHGVADYNDVTSGVPLEAALEDWPYDRAVIRLHGAFSRAGGFQRCLDHIVTTPRNQSLVFFVDADMITYPGLLNRIVTNTVEGVVRERDSEGAIALSMAPLLVRASCDKLTTSHRMWVHSLAACSARGFACARVTRCSPPSRPWCGPPTTTARTSTTASGAPAARA
jgi:hypothetical protein